MVVPPPLLPPQGQGGAHGLHRLLGVHTRLEEALHKLGRLGALLTGPGPEPMPSHWEEEENPVLPAEPDPVSPR